LRDGYQVLSDVSRNVFREFVDFIKGGDLVITSQNSAGLSALANEFGVDELRARLARSPT
jgi:hypothetical protein